MLHSIGTKAIKFYNFLRILSFFLVLLFSKTLEGKTHYKYDVAICTVFRNDARFLKEWIEFHKLCGVQHFWLFNNLSTDDYMTVLNPYIEDKTVDLIEWPYESNDWNQWHEIQNSAFEKGIQLAKGKAKWLAIIDSDEFLFPSKKKRLIDVLKHFEKYGGVYVNWQVFGTSGVKRIPSDKLMIEMLVMKTDKNFIKNRVGKSIVRPERVLKVLNAHRMTYVKGFFEVNENKVKQSSFSMHATKKTHIEKLRINHYWSRDEDFLHNQKLSRRFKEKSDNYNPLMEIENLSCHYDGTILRFVPMLKKKMDL
ncbi:MAG: glycosyltransferase family 92 protein [Chlamydiota bacterium]